MTVDTSPLVGVLTTVIAACASNEVLLSGGFAGTVLALPVALTVAYNGRDYHQSLNPVGDRNAWRVTSTLAVVGTIYAFAHCLKIEDV